MRCLQPFAAALAVGLASLAAAQTSPSQAPSASGSTSFGSSRTSAPVSASLLLKTKQDVRRRLESQGYTQVTNIEQDKDGWMANAMRDGHRVSLDVDDQGNVNEAN